jgi:hypothetical protein
MMYSAYSRRNEIRMKLLSLLSFAVLLLQVGGVNPLTQAKPTGNLEGTITRANSNQVITGARVTVIRRLIPNPAAIPAATTDGRGTFVVSGLEDGVYTIQAEADGYLPGAYATLGATISLVNVSAGQPTRNINIALTPKATISGRVRDRSNQPLVSVPVQLLRYSYNSQGQRFYEPESTVTTDDRGEYRMAWVKPGRYYLLAGKPSTGSNSAEALGARDYAFYPDVKETANAVVIDLLPGMDLPSADLTLEAKPQTFKVRGNLVDSRTGQFPARANVFVTSQIPGLDSNADNFKRLDVQSSNYDGKTGGFEIRDLLPGAYAIVASVMDTTEPGQSGPVLQASGLLAVNVASSDIEGLTIPVVPAGAIPGRVRVEGQLPAQLSIDRLVVRLIPVGANSQTSLPGMIANMLNQNLPTIVGVDGRFRIQNVFPGEYRIEFAGFPVGSGAGGPQYVGSMAAANAYIKDARLDGVDALNAPIRFSGSINSGMEITLTFGRGRVETTVPDVQSQPVRTARVVAVPMARFRTDLYRALSTDEDGRSGFNIPPGDYKFFAWESVEEFGWFDPDLLARSEVRGTSVHVSESTTQTVNVQINPAEKR